MRRDTPGEVWIDPTSIVLLILSVGMCLGCGVMILWMCSFGTRCMFTSSFTTQEEIFLKLLMEQFGFFPFLGSPSFLFSSVFSLSYTQDSEFTLSPPPSFRCFLNQTALSFFCTRGRRQIPQPFGLKHLSPALCGA